MPPRRRLYNFLIDAVRTTSSALQVCDKLEILILSVDRRPARLGALYPLLSLGGGVNALAILPRWIWMGSKRESWGVGERRWILRRHERSLAVAGTKVVYGCDWARPGDASQTRALSVAVV